tara:strand:- start:44 stop:340 length:297 start_codon:yes stop_codon:yes gene_type:complete
MTGIVRVDLDSHAGHNDNKESTPFHKTAYREGSATVFINKKPVVRLGDKTYCGDPAKEVSGTVYVDSKPVHRQGDATAGHSGFVPTIAETGSDTVFAD